MSDHGSEREEFFLELVTELKEVCEWDQLGLQLRLKNSDLKIIEKESRGKVRESMREMLDKWVKSNPDSSWKQIIEALERIDENELAGRLRGKYLNSVPTTHQATTTTTKKESIVATTTQSEAKQKVVMKLKRSGSFSRSFDDVQQEFRIIEVEIQSALENENVCIKKVVRTCRSCLNLDSKGLPYFEGMQVDDLFDKIRPHYSYLNYRLLEEIVQVYLKNHQLIKLMKRYCKQLQYFKQSTELKDLMINIEQAQTPPTSPTCTATDMCTVQLTLVGAWFPCSIKNLETLMKEVFREKASVLQHLEVLAGSVIIIYYAPVFEVDDLIARVEESLSFISNVGIYNVNVTVAEQIIFQKGTGITDVPKFSFRATLFKAVENNDIRLTAFLLAELKINPNDSFYFTAETTHATALFAASQQGLCNIIDLLLSYEAEVNVHTEDGRTPLMVASKHGHVNAVKRLLEGGAYLEEIDMDNDTALRYAVEGNQVEVVKLLLEKDAKPNVVNKEEWSCLLISCCDNYHEIVNLLLQYGANRYHVSSLKKTCLMMASQNGHLETMQILLKEATLKEINQTMDEGWCALSLAYDHPEAVEMLLEYGADPNIPLEDGWTTLMLACEKGCLKTVTALLKKETTKVNLSNFGVTAYGIAQLNNNEETMKALIEAGANPKPLSFALKMLANLLKAKLAKKEERRKLPLVKRFAQTAMSMIRNRV